VGFHTAEAAGSKPATPTTHLRRSTATPAIGSLVVWSRSIVLGAWLGHAAQRYGEASVAAWTTTVASRSGSGRDRGLQDNRSHARLPWAESTAPSGATL
jgi:hypothetical protein